MDSFAVALITLYQRILAPYWPGKCRHTPTCSEYTKDAITQLGVPRGIWLGLKRISRCRPLGTSGYDPVPREWPTRTGTRRRERGSRLAQ